MIIYKFPVNVYGPTQIHVSENAKIVSAGLQDDMPYVWVMHDSSTISSTRTLEVVATGAWFYADNVEHIGTLTNSSGYVMHVLEHKL